LACTAALFVVQCLFCDAGAFAIWLRTAMAAFKVALFFAGAICVMIALSYIPILANPEKFTEILLCELCVYVQSWMTIKKHILTFLFQAYILA